MMLSLITVETLESMTRITTGNKALVPALLRVTMPHSLWVFVDLEQLEDSCVEPSSVREGAGNRSQYAPDAPGQRGRKVEDREGEGEPHCIGLEGVTRLSLQKFLVRPKSPAATER